MDWLVICITIVTDTCAFCSNAVGHYSIQLLYIIHHMMQIQDISCDLTHSNLSVATLMTSNCYSSGMSEEYLCLSKRLCQH